MVMIRQTHSPHLKQYYLGSVCVSRRRMASTAMTCSFLGSTTNLSKLPTAGSNTGRRRVVMMGGKASVSRGDEEKRLNQRRELVFAAAAAAMCSISAVAMADEDEPKRGSPDAKKKYAPVCITNPTARICRN